MSIMPKQFKGKIVEDGTSSWDVLAGAGIVAVSLGIQAPPNTVFKINDGDNIYIGATGIYELNLQQGLGTISQLIILNAVEDASGDILIDILYEGSDVNSDISTSQIQEAEWV